MIISILRCPYSKRYLKIIGRDQGPILRRGRALEVLLNPDSAGGGNDSKKRRGSFTWSSLPRGGGGQHGYTVATTTAMTTVTTAGEVVEAPEPRVIKQFHPKEGA